jgi:hypothetical protein
LTINIFGLQSQKAEFYYFLSTKELYMKIFRRTMLIFLPLIVLSSGSIASSGSNLVDTIIGQLTVEKAEGNVNVKYGNRILWSEPGMGGSLEKIASLKDEDVLLYDFQTGGNGIYEQTSLILAKKSGKFVHIAYVGINMGERKIEMKGNKVIIKSSNGPFRPPLIAFYQNGRLSGDGVQFESREEYGINIEKRYADIPTYSVEKMHPYRLLVDNKVVQSEVRKLLKKDFLLFTDNIMVASPGEIKGDYYVGDGNAPHQGTTEHAILCINLYNGKIYAAVFHKGEKITIYGAKSLSYVPGPMQDWIQRIKANFNRDIYGKLVFQN